MMSLEDTPSKHLKLKVAKLSWPNCEKSEHTQKSAKRHRIEVVLKYMNPKMPSIITGSVPFYGDRSSSLASGWLADEFIGNS
jgi:hypothetical protein